MGRRIPQKSSQRDLGGKRLPNSDISINEVSRGTSRTKHRGVWEGQQELSTRRRGEGAYKTPQAAYKTPQATREGNEEKGKSWQRRAAGGEKEEEKPQETRVTGIYLYEL